jgi:hypothetical protein
VRCDVPSQVCRKASSSSAVQPQRPPEMYNALTNQPRENVPVITDVTSRKPCRCLAFGATTSNGRRGCLGHVFVKDGDKSNCIRSILPDIRPRGSHVLELPPTHARTTHSPCTPHPRRSTKASIGILAPTHRPMGAFLISVTKPKHVVCIHRGYPYLSSKFWN